ADVDGDGDMDVLSASPYDDKIAWYENDGAGNFTAHTITTAADDATSVTTADVDGDGDLDVLSASINDDKIAWYENDGAENFTAHTITTGADAATSVTTADVDGDGDLDVLSASINDDKIAWYENTAVNTLDGTPTFTEGGAAVVLDADVDISDAELDALNSGNGDYDGASVTLVRNGGVSTEDVFSFSDGNSISLSVGDLYKNGQIIADFDITTTSGQLVITFTNANGETPTSTDVDNILRQITYENSSDAPPASAQIDWSFDDGDASVPLQATGDTTVTITATNDAPTATNNTVATNEDTTYTFAASDFNYSDVDGDTLASVEITTLEAVGALQLSGADVTLNQVISKADIDAGNLKFVPVADANGTGYDSFGFSVNDGTVDSVSTYTMTIDVSAQNDAPTAANNTVAT
ncbi:MAG: hypothetical protein GY926_12175, partial [bacterium]|nr:hypothetical protein [bacterium]